VHIERHSELLPGAREDTDPQKPHSDLWKSRRVNVVENRLGVFVKRFGRQEDQRLLAELVVKHGELEDEIANAPDPASIAHRRERDREYDRQQLLQRQLQMLRAGTLLRAPGETYESLAYLDARIAELTERRDRAQRALDSYVAAAEQLLAGQPVTI
jgi:hypothetical protein